MKRGQKRNPDLLGQGTKEKQSVNNLAYPYSRWRSKSSTTCLTQSQVEVAIVHFYFSIFYFSFLHV